MAVSKKLISDVKKATEPVVVSKADGDELAAAGHAQIVGVSADGLQVQVVASAASTEAVADTAPVAATYTVLSGISVPSRNGGGFSNRAETYPISKLDIGCALYVPNSDKVKDAPRKMASTASAVTRKFSSPDPSGVTYTSKNGKVKPKLVATKKFEVRSVKFGVKYDDWTCPADGALVFRTA